MRSATGQINDRNNWKAGWPSLWWLSLSSGGDQIPTGERRKICDEGVLPHQVIDVKIGRARNRLGPGRYVDHLPCTKILELARIFDQGNSRAPFQDVQPVATNAF